LIVAETGTDVLTPPPMNPIGVAVSYLVDVPYWNTYTTGSPPGETVAWSTAEVLVTPVAEPVVTVTAAEAVALVAPSAASEQAAVSNSLANPLRIPSSCC
jgi:hypothetical protein